MIWQLPQPWPAPTMAEQLQAASPRQAAGALCPVSTPGLGTCVPQNLVPAAPARGGQEQSDHQMFPVCTTLSPILL